MVLVTTLAELWQLLLVGAEKLRPLQPYVVIGTFLSALGGFFAIVSTWRKVSRDRRKVDIVIVNCDTQARHRVVSLPAAKVTRSEVLGTLRLAAGGKMLDTSQTTLLKQDFFAIGREVLIELPPADFDAVCTGSM